MLRSRYASRAVGTERAKGARVVCNWNQVWVSGTETKVNFRYWYWSLNFFSETETFFFWFFKLFSCFPFSWGDTSFYVLENDPKSSKNNQKYLILGFRGAFLKKNLDFSFEMWFRYRLWYWPKGSTNLDFGFGPKP